MWRWSCSVCVWSWFLFLLSETPDVFPSSSVLKKNQKSKNKSSSNSYKKFVQWFLSVVNQSYEQNANMADTREDRSQLAPSRETDDFSPSCLLVCLLSRVHSLKTAHRNAPDSHSDFLWTLKSFFATSSEYVWREPNIFDETSRWSCWLLVENIMFSW